MDYKKLKQELSKMDSVKRNFLMVDLLISKSIDFIDISNAYTKYLEDIGKMNKTEKRLIAGCLATKYQNINDSEYNDARSSLLIQPYVPDGFVKKFFNVSKKAIEKEKKFLKSEIENIENIENI